MEFVEQTCLLTVTSDFQMWNVFILLDQRNDKPVLTDTTLLLSLLPLVP